VGKCSHGANLLLNTNPKNAFKIATELDQFNKERQLLEKDLLEKILNETKNCITDPVLVLSGNNWHEGVIGIVAARLKDKFHKPVIIISIQGQIGKASARSIVGFDIGSSIIAATQDKILIKGGGHKMAGGFSINIQNINKFKDFIFRKFRQVNEDLTREKPLFFDSVISSTAVNLDFYNKVNTLAPFGSGNPEPKFIIENLKTANGKIVGEKHIKSVLIGQDGTSFKTIAFNAVENNIGGYLLKNNSKLFNIAGKLSLNEWKGQSNVEFIIDDISVNKTVKNKVPSSIG
jgi:single-stranded-DNA-specific exonuclease